MSCSFQTRSSANRPVGQRDLGPELARRVGANPVALGSERRTTCAGTIAKAANATSHALELLGGEGLRAKRVSRCQRRNRSLQPIHHPIRRVQVRGRAREDGSLWPTRCRLCLRARRRCPRSPQLARPRSQQGQSRGRKRPRCPTGSNPVLQGVPQPGTRADGCETRASSAVPQRHSRDSAPMTSRSRQQDRRESNPRLLGGHAARLHARSRLPAATRRIRSLRGHFRR